MSRRAVLDAEGKVVNVVEVTTGDITAGHWGPPDGHTVVMARTTDGDKLSRGDTAHRETGALVSRKPVPAVPDLPEATILVYGDDVDTPRDQFDLDDVVNIRVTLSDLTVNRTIAVPVDRLNAAGEILEHAALWLRLAVVQGVGTISRAFPATGRYGVGLHTSQEFDVPETSIIIFH